MWSPCLTQLAVAFFLLASVNAGVIVRTPSERFFLANCGSPGRWTRSQVGYYVTNAQEIEGGNPTSLFDWGRVITWEGTSNTANLPNGDTFTSSINANAASQANWAVVGTGKNSRDAWQCSMRFAGGTFPVGWTLDSGEVCSVLYECATGS